MLNLRLTDAFSIVRHPDGPAEQAGGLSQVAGALIGDPIVSTQVQIRRCGRGANPITRHTVGVVGLVNHAVGGSRAQDLTARLWRQVHTCMNKSSG